MSRRSYWPNKLTELSTNQGWMKNRNRRLMSSAGVPVAVICCGFIPAIANCAASGSMKQAILLGSAQQIRRQFDVLNVRRVAHAFADVNVGSARTTVSPEELEMMLGPQNPASAGSENAELTTVEIETRTQPGIRETGIQARVPFGIAGIAWGSRHPTKAWRLLVPILGDDQT
jgi:hypothetical protein